MEVHKPPKTDEKDRGIKIVEGESFTALADCSAIGIMSASAPTLFINADRKAVIKHNAPIYSSLFFMIGVMCCSTKLTMPVWLIVFVITMTVATVMIAGLLKPINASDGGMRPRTTRAIKLMRATVS